MIVDARASNFWDPARDSSERRAALPASRAYRAAPSSVPLRLSTISASSPLKK
jgi:hypothetical protein